MTKARLAKLLTGARNMITIRQRPSPVSKMPRTLARRSYLRSASLMNWEQTLSMSPQQVEDLVGRTTNDAVIPSRDDRSHIECARAQDDDGNTISVLSLGLRSANPRRSSATIFSKKAPACCDESGFWARYAKSARALEIMMHCDSQQATDRCDRVADMAPWPDRGRRVAAGKGTFRF